jgi:D-lactate dehydrogenase (cytochrome)
LKILVENFGRYLNDESNTGSVNIDSVYIPENDSETADLLDKNIHLTVYAGGTGIVAGGTAAEGSIISLENFKFLHIDAALMEVSAGAGVTLRDLNAVLAENGLWYPADSTEQSATIGGNAATCAWGTRSFKYGSIREYIKAVHVIIPGLGKLRLARGENIAAGDSFPAEMASSGKKIFLPGAYKTALNIADTVSGYPRKNSAGYFMKKDMDLVDLIIGSEGTLGIITMLEFNVLRRPRDITAFMCYFNDEKDAFGFVEKAKTLKGVYSPCSVEFMDRESLQLLRRKSFNVKEKGAAVFIEIETPGDESDGGVIEYASDFFGSCGIDRDDVVVSSTKEKKDHIYAVREGLPRAVNSEIRLAGLKKLATDFAVSNGKEWELIEIYEKMRRDTGVRSVLFGHAGDNNLHLNFIPADAGEYMKARKACEEAAKKVGAIRGTIAAEHGVGKMKKHMLEYMYNKNVISTMRSVKEKFDPGFILNRGNVI